ncbi:transposase [Desulfopila sp. IMCC35006]|uniref:transposase n=1 Tax=Desulfopila sp. IMCC35006 TaxID=2569542 RepID=UPI00197AA0E7|nr:transposase [Desulfopila sp. IMCC35006]
MQKFIPTNRDQQYLFRPSIQDWLPEKHLARFIIDIVSQLNLQPLTETYAGKGFKGYHPEILISLLFYGYATGVFSSRKIEKATYDSVAFRFISANTHPDHDTIATFRKRFLQQLKPLFVEILMLAREMGLLKLGKVSLDGTEVKANASKHHALSWDHACKLEQQLKAEVDELIRLAEQADSEQISEVMDIPEELCRRQDRLEAIAQAKIKIEERAAQRYAQEQKEHEEKVAKRREKAESTGKKPRGPKPKPPTAGPRKNDQVNLTDEESRIMPSSDKGFVQVYNGQAAVDVDTMLIIKAHISQSPNDKREFTQTLASLNELPEELGKIEVMLTDAGHYSDANAASCMQSGMEPFIPPNRDKHSQPLVERFIDPAPLPENAEPIDKMRQKLKTVEGRKVYAERKSTVEPVFGIIKHVLGFWQFFLRGLEAVSGEWTLVSMAWNLKRMFSLNG